MKDELIISLMILTMGIGLPLLITTVRGKEEPNMAPVIKQTFNELTVTVIYDNYPAQAGFTTAWGFACVIQGTENTILFDTGGDGAILLANMAKAGIDPEAIDLVVLSHQHWDHTGGIYHVLHTNARVQIFLPQSFSTHFKQDLQRYGAELIEVHDAVEICPGVSSTGDLAGPIREQSLVLQTPKGIIVITGCAHPGIAHIIQWATALFPGDLLLVMGGFHLMNDNEALIRNVVSQFRELGVRYVAASHCTGDRARQMFAQEYQHHYLPVGAGTVITLKELP